jgi:hypothetical protein
MLKTKCNKNSNSRGHHKSDSSEPKQNALRNSEKRVAGKLWGAFLCGRACGLLTRAAKRARLNFCFVICPNQAAAGAKGHVFHVGAALLDDDISDVGPGQDIFLDAAKRRRAVVLAPVHQVPHRRLAPLAREFSRCGSP